MSADVPAVTPQTDVPAVDPGVLEAEANKAAIDAVSSDPDDQVGDRLFGLTEVPADVAERMKAHPDAGAGLLGAMLVVEASLTGTGEVSKGETSRDKESSVSTDRFDANKALETLNELQGTGNDGQLRALYADEIAPGRWRNYVTGEDISATDVADAREEWLKDPSKFAAGFWYEINRVATVQEFGLTAQKTAGLLNEAVSWPKSTPDGIPVRFSDNDVESILDGVKTANVHGHLSAKHVKFEVNNEGLYEYTGIDALKFIVEMATKYKGYELAQLSPVDVATREHIAKGAKETLIDLANQPGSARYVKAQEILKMNEIVLGALKQETGTADATSEVASTGLDRIMKATGLDPDSIVRLLNSDLRLSDPKKLRDQKDELVELLNSDPGAFSELIEYEKGKMEPAEATDAESGPEAEPYGIWVGHADRGPGVYKFKPLPKEIPTDAPVVPPTSAQ